MEKFKIKEESEKNKLGKIYSKALINLFCSGKISEPEMDNVVQDVEILFEVAKTKFWVDIMNNIHRFTLPPQEILSIFEKSIFPHLSSEFTKTWVKQQIEAEYSVVIKKSLKYFLRAILLVYVEVPEYIKLTDKHREKIKKFVRHFYRDRITERSEIHYIKLNYEHVKTDPKFEAGEEYVQFANQLFDFKINIIEKKIITV